MKMNDIRYAFTHNPTLKEWHSEEQFRGQVTKKQMEKLIEEGLAEKSESRIWTVKSGWHMVAHYRAK